MNERHQPVVDLSFRYVGVHDVDGARRGQDGAVEMMRKQQQ